MFRTRRVLFRKPAHHNDYLYSDRRKMYKNLIAGQRSALTHERRLALESIGFQFILRPSRTRAKILEIEGMKPADVAAPSNSNNNTMYHEGHGGGGIVHHTM